MKRLFARIALIGLLLGPIAYSWADSDESGNEEFEWKMITAWPKNLPALGRAAEDLAKIIDEMSAGRLKIKVYGAGELVGPFEVFDTVSEGAAEVGHGAAYYWRGKAPAAALFTTVPFGMTAQEMNAWLHYGGGIELWRELYAKFNLIPIPAGNTGVQMAGWFNKEINSLADLKGLKMRIPGLGGEVMKRAGAIPVSLPGSEIFTSLQTGVVDAAEWIGPYNDLALGFHDVAKYYYYPGWHEPGATLETIINKDAWNSLPRDLQKIVEVACRAINQDVLDEFTARNNAALNTLVKEHGVELRGFPEDVMARFREISIQLVKEIPGDDPLAQRIVDSYVDFYEQVREFHQISEEAYLWAR